MIQTGVYGSVLHYLKAIKAAGTDDPAKVMAKMRELPIEDIFVHGGKLREDGRVIRDMYLAKVKIARAVQGAVGLSGDRQDREGRGRLPPGLRIQMSAAEEVRRDMTGNERNAIETYECDVLVVGSGAAGMSAAITARLSRPRRADRREGAALRRHHRALRRLALDSRHLAGARPTASTEAPEQARTYLRHEAGNNFDAARVDAFLERGPGSRRFLHHQDRAALRHAAGVSGLSRRSAGRRAGRPLHGDAPVRRPRTRRPDQERWACRCPS